MTDLAHYVDGLVEGRRGTLVQRQKDRSVWRVEEDGRVWFAKRGVTLKRRREIRREAQNARALQSAGLGPDVLAAGAHGNAEWLVTADAGESFLMAMGRKESGQLDRDAIVHDLGSFVRTLHDSGWTCPDLTDEHVCVGASGLRLIDPARLRHRRVGVSIADRAADLAALLFSCAPWFGNTPISRSDRIRLLRDASELQGVALRRLCNLVDKRLYVLSERTRWRHNCGDATEEFDEIFHRGLQAIPPRGEDTVPYDWLISPDWLEVVRTLPDRENRLVRGPTGQPLFFVKAFPSTRKGWSPAMREYAAIELFQRSGILVNHIAAFAEDVDKGSMIAVKACDGEPLDDLLRRGVTVVERRALAVQTARIWRRMRECGLRHRDAYPCHVFTRLAANGAELRLIDMTRAGKAPFPKERWFIKDAAALWHGVPRPPVTRTDAVRWLREYFRIDRLDARAKRFARRVAAKEHRIAARQARKRRA